MSLREPVLLEWHDGKRQINLAGHGIDFLDASRPSNGRPVVTLRSSFPDEERYLTFGVIDGRFVTVISTQRGDAIRIISAGRAPEAEKRHDRALHGPGA